MERKLIAIGIDENRQVFKAHFGMAKRYLIFNKHGKLIKEIENPYVSAKTHHDSPVLIKDLLSDVGIFIGHRMGKNSQKNLQTKWEIKTFLTKEKSPEQALQAFFDQEKNQA